MYIAFVHVSGMKKIPILFFVRRQGRDTIVIDFGYVLGRFLWLDSHGNACMLWKIVRGEAAFSSRKIVDRLLLA